MKKFSNMIAERIFIPIISICLLLNLFTLDLKAETSDSNKTGKFGLSPYKFEIVSDPELINDSIRFDGYMIFKIDNSCDTFQLLIHDIYLLHCSIFFVKELNSIFEKDKFYYYNNSTVQFINHTDDSHEIDRAMTKHMKFHKGGLYSPIINFAFVLDSLLKYLPHPITFTNLQNHVYLIFKVSTTTIELNYTANQIICNDENNLLPIEHGKFLFPTYSDYTIERLELKDIESLCKPFYVDEGFWDRINSQVKNKND